MGTRFFVLVQACQFLRGWFFVISAFLASGISAVIAVNRRFVSWGMEHEKRNAAEYIPIRIWEWVP